MALELRSRSFENGASIPMRYTCDGDNTSPHLAWDGAPKETVTFALLVEDPDAPGGLFTHWVMYNIPGDVGELEEIVPAAKNLDNGGTHGKNDFGKYGYGGPCPPSGEHRYFFRLYALKKKLEPESGASRDALLSAMKDNIIEEAEYMGVYRKKK